MIKIINNKSYLCSTNLKVGDKFKFTDHWYGQFIFEKNSETTVRNLDTDHTSNFWEQDVVLVNDTDFKVGDPERLKKYLDFKVKHTSKE